VLVARRGDQVVGHVLFIPSGVQWEIKSIAVLRCLQRQGIGAALVRSVLQCAAVAGCLQVVVGTATADIDNLLLSATGLPDGSHRKERVHSRPGIRSARSKRDPGP
jgi:GNAT superfamily N-acetyltransferase